MDHQVCNLDLDVNILPFQSDFNMAFIVVTELTKAVRICALVIVCAATADYTSVTCTEIWRQTVRADLLFFLKKTHLMLVFQVSRD